MRSCAPQNARAKWPSARILRSMGSGTGRSCNSCPVPGIGCCGNTRLPTARRSADRGLHPPVLLIPSSPSPAFLPRHAQPRPAPSAAKTTLPRGMRHETTTGSAASAALQQWPARRLRRSPSPILQVSNPSGSPSGTSTPRKRNSTPSPATSRARWTSSPKEGTLFVPVADSQRITVRGQSELGGNESVPMPLF